MNLPRSRTGTSFHLQDVTVRRGSSLILEDLSLQVGSGEAVAFVGPSGSGKTTLLRLLGGALTPSAGKLLLDG